jgi:hypothetical protein
MNLSLYDAVVSSFALGDIVNNTHKACTLITKQWKTEIMHSSASGV